MFLSIAQHSTSVNTEFFSQRPTGQGRFHNDLNQFRIKHDWESSAITGILRVFLFGPPAKMAWVTTWWVIAGVQCVSPSSFGTRSTSAFKGDLSCHPVTEDFAVSVRILVKRPFNTVVGVQGQNNFVNPYKSRASGDSTPVRVAMALPAVVVSSAHSLSVSLPVTVFNRADLHPCILQEMAA